MTATTALHLYALEREHFLTAVTGHAESTENAEALNAGRVGALRPSE